MVDAWNVKCASGCIPRHQAGHGVSILVKTSCVRGEPARRKVTKLGSPTPGQQSGLTVGEQFQLFRLLKRSNSTCFILFVLKIIPVITVKIIALPVEENITMIFL